MCVFDAERLPAVGVSPSCQLGIGVPMPGLHGEHVLLEDCSLYAFMQMTVPWCASSADGSASAPRRQYKCTNSAVHEIRVRGRAPEKNFPGPLSPEQLCGPVGG